MSYGKFAYFYDRLMQDVPYDKWVDLVNIASSKYEVKGKKLLDLACGTGELSIRFADTGYQVTGVDLSTDMLTLAQSKAANKGYPIQFIHQNMAELDLDEHYDIIGIFCDSINYLLTENEVKETLKNAYQYLNNGGLIIFDVHSIYKVTKIFMDQTFTFDDEDICYIWNCFQGEHPFSIEHELTFFVQDESGKYDRFDENHTQRSFPVDSYKAWLNEVGFEVLEMIGDFKDEPLQEQTERVFFTGRKNE